MSLKNKNRVFELKFLQIKFKYLLIKTIFLVDLKLYYQ